MPHTARPARNVFEPRNPDWDATVRASFARQKVMTLIGAEIGELKPGRCEIRLPFRDDLTQQNGFFHAASSHDLLGIYPNQLTLDEETIRQNVRKVQERDNISAQEAVPGMDFSIEDVAGK